MPGPQGPQAHEHKGFSRHGEDGIVAEIFRRIGTTNRYFVEFGASDGTESNTLLWLCAGWSGLWMEGDPDAVARAQQRFRSYIAAGKLTIRQALIDAENVEGLFRKAGVPEEFDLLSLDIDYNDYYVWEAIQSFRPRVVEIEYNAIWPPDVEWVVPYDPKAMWDHTARFGASLKSFEKLGRQKGYSLVGCAFRGGNAFFVRDDLLGDHFSAPTRPSATTSRGTGGPTVASSDRFPPSPGHHIPPLPGPRACEGIDSGSRIRNSEWTQTVAIQGFRNRGSGSPIRFFHTLRARSPFLRRRDQ